MNEPMNRDGDFEERLLVRLKAVVAERGAAAADPGPQPGTSPGPQRRRPLRLVLAGVAALAVAVVILIVSSGGSDTSRAFAVEPLRGGGVAIKIYSLEDAAGLEAALEREGIPAHVDWLPAQMTCSERHLTPSSVQTAMGGRAGGFEIGGPAPALTIGVMTADQYRTRSRAFRSDVRDGGPDRATLPNVTFEPHSFRPGQSVVIVGSPEPHDGDPEGGYRARIEVVEGPVPACKPVPEAAGSIGAIAVRQGGAAGGGESAATAAIPKPGQFVFTKTEVVQLQNWEPEGRGTGSRAHPRHFTSRAPATGTHAMEALVPTTKEVWTAADGKTHVRETLGQIEFLSPADQRRWEEAGSPPPFEYDPAEHHVKQDSAGNAMKEYSSHDWRGRHAFAIVPKLYKLPTEAEALRLAIEHRPAGSGPAAASSREGSTTVQRLLEILAEPEASPELGAAAFAALGEIPGIEREADATDAAGRHGEALTWDTGGGFGRKVIFDPRTSRVLAESEVILGSPSSGHFGVPLQTVFRETAYLGSAIVGSEGQTPPG